MAHFSSPQLEYRLRLHTQRGRQVRKRVYDNVRWNFYRLLITSRVWAQSAVDTEQDDGRETSIRNRLQDLIRDLEARDAEMQRILRTTGLEAPPPGAPMVDERIQVSSPLENVFIRAMELLDGIVLKQQVLVSEDIEDSGQMKEKELEWRRRFGMFAKEVRQYSRTSDENTEDETARIASDQTPDLASK